MQETFEEQLTDDPLEACLVHEVSEDEPDKEVAMYERYLSANPSLNEQRSVRYEPLPSTLENLGKIEDQTAPKVELKTLPSSLRYSYLGPNCTYPIIVNA